MMRQRTIHLNPDEILIVKSGHDPREMLEVQIILDKKGEAHVFTSSRPFAHTYHDQSLDQRKRIIEDANLFKFGE